MIPRVKTIDVADGQQWDIVVIGAGPAGATIGKLLSAAGLSVLIVDKVQFPRSKVCGCCLSGRAVATLERLDLEHVLSSAIPVEHLCLGAAGRQVEIPTPGGMTISRERLDTELLCSAIDSGASFASGWTATVGNVECGKRIVHLKARGNALQVHGRIVLACGGLGQKVLESETKREQQISSHAKIGAAAQLSGNDCYPVGTISMACGSAGYVGIVRLESGRLDVATALSTVTLKKVGSVASAIEQLICEAGFPPLEGVHDADWKGTIPLTRKRTQLSGERFFVLGDAAGYLEPFTGEGMSWAFAGAEAVFPLVLNAIENWSSDAEDQWRLLYRKRVVRQQWACWGLKKTLERPYLVSLLVPLLQFAPRLSAPFVRSVHGSGIRSKAKSP